MIFLFIGIHIMMLVVCLSALILMKAFYKQRLSSQQWMRNQKFFLGIFLVLNMMSFFFLAQIYMQNSNLNNGASSTNLIHY